MNPLIWLTFVLAACTGDEQGSDKAPPLQTTPTETTPSFLGRVPKNLLIFSIDTFRRDHLGKYDDQGRALTPFLSQLMTEGYTADNHMTCANWTYMGTGCTMNGRYNEENGFIPELGGLRAPMPNGPQMASVLGELGFYNILVTGNSWFSGQWNMSQGFDEEQLSGGAAVNIYGEGQRRLSDAELRGAIDDRWYLHVHVMEPHAPYVPPEDYLAEEEALAPLDWDLSIKDEHYAAGAAYPTASADEQALIKAHMEARYNAEIRYLDDQFRTIFADLTARGLLEDTLVVFWNDHGEQMWEHGNQSHAHNLYAEENNGVLFFWAQNIVPGSTELPTSQIDLLPTLHQLFGGAPRALPPEITGIPIGEIPDDRIRFALTSARNGTAQAIRQGDHKLVYTWASGKLELFDVPNDPHDANSLYDPNDPIVQDLWLKLLPQINLANVAVLDESPTWPLELLEAMQTTTTPTDTGGGNGTGGTGAPN
jgi:arylsulfatase A-like enzyme